MEQNRDAQQFAARERKKLRPVSNTLGELMVNKKLILISIIAIYFSGCCLFAPCHRATRAIGTVKDFQGQPLNDAIVQLYGVKKATGPNGCFKYDLADGLPFTLSAEAPGYKFIEVPSKPGFFIIKVILANADSNESSTVFWDEISAKEYEDLACP